MIVMSTICLLGFSQSKIGRFYGVNLGDSKSAIERGVDSQGKTGTWKYSSSDHCDYYSVQYPKIAECVFDRANFYVNEIGLFKAVFSSADGGMYMDPNHPANPVGKFNAKARECRSTFETLADKLSDKYGVPFQSSDSRIVWKNNGRKVTLEYEYKKDRNQFGTYDAHTRVALTYEIIDISSGNY